MNSTILEFDHFIGFNTIPNGVKFHPNNMNYIYASGGNIVIADLIDPHIQHILRKHDDYITVLELSKSGELIASGQRGNNSNIIIWSFQTHEILFIFEEFDVSVQGLSFTYDDKILSSLGAFDDAKILHWDLSSGGIIASSHKLGPQTTCILNGGFFKDIKRRDTQNYVSATGDAEGTSNE